MWAGTKKTATAKRMKEIISLVFVLSALALFLCGTSEAEMYRWVDENGEIQITDSPPPNIKSAGEVKIYRDIPQDSRDTEPLSDVKKQESKLSIETKKNPEVILYGTSWCPYCRKARDFFRSRGIDFIDYDIEKDKEAAIRKKELDPRGGVPFVIINGRSIHGYSESDYERALQE
ncbi:MAG TPA: glutaredoxin family protein [Syntrophales bacterium]|nr:glutaredoxin family protein [Syntrophales bacterium]